MKDDCWSLKEEGAVVDIFFVEILDLNYGLAQIGSFLFIHCLFWTEFLDP